MELKWRPQTNGTIFYSLILLFKQLFIRYLKTRKPKLKYYLKTGNSGCIFTVP